MISVSFCRIAGVLALTATVSCADRVTTIEANQSTEIHVGDVVHVEMTLMAFQVDTPPAISSPALQFIDAAYVPQKFQSPAGPTWDYRFRAAEPGQAIITFRRHFGANDTSLVYDTVNVR